MIDNDKADLIVLAADKGMKGKDLEKLINKIDVINQLMDINEN